MYRAAQIVPNLVVRRGEVEKRNGDRDFGALGAHRRAMAMDLVIAVRQTLSPSRYLAGRECRAAMAGAIPTRHT